MAKKRDGKPDCPECHGDGVVTLEYNNDPRTQRDVPCVCTDEEEDEDDFDGGDYFASDPARVEPSFLGRAHLPALCGVCGSPTTSDKWRNGVKVCAKCL